MCICVCVCVFVYMRACECVGYGVRMEGRVECKSGG